MPVISQSKTLIDIKPKYSYRRYYCHKLNSLAKRIKKLEHQLDCEEVTALQQSTGKLSLKQLTQRVEKLERKVKNHQNSHQLSTRTCLKFLLSIAADWQNIGVFLNISDSDLKQIESDYSGRCRDCIREMIRKWLKQVNPAPSWKNLAEAVEEIDPSIAERIHKQLQHS